MSWVQRSLFFSRPCAICACNESENSNLSSHNPARRLARCENIFWFVLLLQDQILLRFGFIEKRCLAQALLFPFCLVVFINLRRKHKVSSEPVTAILQGRTNVFVKGS
ncbi:hypothetical protein BJ508DRAFT_128061 [Ascobolus immersus RN42]|uniref:Uncharacterized protein n=1 Tax=Ascobolus immersus RN42 TaxID=1160509 RepID=A0A3N4I356_ASCIM|nr:hypothetical protein BJ508DRAFT_128061 [Ascobolus immersus RN42]